MHLMSTQQPGISYQQKAALNMEIAHQRCLNPILRIFLGFYQGKADQKSRLTGVDAMAKWNQTAGSLHFCSKRQSLVEQGETSCLQNNADHVDRTNVHWTFAAVYIAHWKPRTRSGHKLF